MFFHLIGNQKKHVLLIEIKQVSLSPYGLEIAKESESNGSSKI